MMPKISIVIPVYNIEKYVEVCVRSVSAQTLEDIEILCVNDGSTDGSLEMLRVLERQDSRIRVIDQENKGLSGARNAGMESASGEFLMFVDGDDWIDPDMCRVMYEKAKESGADCVMCSYVKEFGTHNIVNHIFLEDLVWHGKEVRTCFYRRLFGLLGEELKTPENNDLIVSACMQLFRREIGVKEFVDTRLIGTEDLLYQIMVYADCRTFAYIDRPFYHYRKTNEESLTSTYRKELFAKWNHLYDRIEDIMRIEDLGADYHQSFHNRIALSMIGLGLNEIHAQDKGFLQKKKALKEFLLTTRYQEAMKQLDISGMPLHWKIFFILCKCRCSFGLILGLYTMEYLRKKVG